MGCIFFNMCATVMFGNVRKQNINLSGDFGVGLVGGFVAGSGLFLPILMWCHFH